jgi:hypothetical protein
MLIRKQRFPITGIVQVPGMSLIQRFFNIKYKVQAAKFRINSHRSIKIYLKKIFNIVQKSLFSEIPHFCAVLVTEKQNEPF